MSGGEPLFCGVDVGATATKLVLMTGDGTVVARDVRHSGVDYRETARACRDAALEVAGATVRQIAATVSTGYGRRNVDFADDVMTEIHCHGVGCYHLVPDEITIVDIGGQDNKIIRIGADGRRIDFKMNRKCAAGTGAFIEEMALRLGIDVSEMDALAAATEKSVRLGSFCTVFAKTEVLAHLRKGVPVGEIVRGAFLSVINRVVEMDQLPGRVVMTGGVVEYNRTVAAILSEKLGKEVDVPPHPQFTGALGAALAARNLIQPAAT